MHRLFAWFSGIKHPPITHSSFGLIDIWIVGGGRAVAAACDQVLAPAAGAQTSAAGECARWWHCFDEILPLDAVCPTSQFNTSMAFYTITNWNNHIKVAIFYLTADFSWAFCLNSLKYLRLLKFHHSVPLSRYYWHAAIKILAYRCIVQQENLPLQLSIIGYGNLIWILNPKESYMVNYLLELIASVGHGGQIHDDLVVGLTSAEVNTIIEYLKE